MGTDTPRRLRGEAPPIIISSSFDIKAYYQVTEEMILGSGMITEIWNHRYLNVHCNGEWDTA